MYPAIPVASFRSRKHFHRASKSSNETVTDWYARIHSMAESCQYGDASGILLLDKFIIGLDDELFDRICTEVGYLSLEQSMKLAIQIEEEFNILPVRSHTSVAAMNCGVYFTMFCSHFRRTMSMLLNWSTCIPRRRYKM